MAGHEIQAWPPTSITSQKNGVSAQGLQRLLGFASYDTAWAWLHKLRRAMVRPERELLGGVVELDEVFIGNESRGRAGGVKDNCAAMIAVESLPGRKLGRVRIEVAPTARSAGLLAFADRVIAKGSLIKTERQVGQRGRGGDEGAGAQRQAGTGLPQRRIHVVTDSGI